MKTWEAASFVRTAEKALHEVERCLEDADRPMMRDSVRTAIEECHFLLHYLASELRTSSVRPGTSGKVG